MATELNLQVNETNNEFLLSIPASYLLNWVSLWAGWHSGAFKSYGIGARFRDVTIPKGSIIEEAYITLTCKSSNTGANDIRHRVSAEQEDDPPDFSSDNYASALARWGNRTAQVDWDSTRWILNQEYSSPDIKTVIQAIVNRPGWASGNHLVIFWEDWDDRTPHVINDTINNGYSYAGVPAKTIKLYIRYSPISLPAVTTDPAKDIGEASATLNGALDDDGGKACDCGFEYGLDTSYGTTTPTQSKNTGETFEQAITGLDPNTTYHFRAFATNSAGTSYGADRTFTTETATPSVTTDPATEVGQTTATLNGPLDDDGGEVCDCYFEYGETTDYGATTATQSKSTGETFSQEVRGLKPSTTYHFRAVATNSAGTSYGADRTFRTTELSAEAHQALGKSYPLSRAEV